MGKDYREIVRIGFTVLAALVCLGMVGYVLNWVFVGSEPLKLVTVSNLDIDGEILMVDFETVASANYPRAYYSIAVMVGDDFLAPANDDDPDDMEIIIPERNKWQKQFYIGSQSGEAELIVRLSGMEQETVKLGTVQGAMNGEPAKIKPWQSWNSSSSKPTNKRVRR
jgi:hypothetical protein